MPEPPRIVDWYRVDPWPRMRRVLFTGPLVLALGGLVTAASFLGRVPRDLRGDATLLGVVLVAGGALFTIVGMSHILRDDVYLALRTDGVVLRLAGLETLVLWDELASVRWNAPPGELVLERSAGAPLAVPRRFRGIEGTALAERILQTRRKAAMSLLR
ncbi:MAG TPA: hypothetical protein VGL81_30185 [Polyangiaceae bacterium]|jgi:hypothetical protein